MPGCVLRQSQHPFLDAEVFYLDDPNGNENGIVTRREPYIPSIRSICAVRSAETCFWDLFRPKRRATPGAHDKRASAGPLFPISDDCLERAVHLHHGLRRGAAIAEIEIDFG